MTWHCFKLPGTRFYAVEPEYRNIRSIVLLKSCLEPSEMDGKRQETWLFKVFEGVFLNQANATLPSFPPPFRPPRCEIDIRSSQLLSVISEFIKLWEKRVHGFVGRQSKCQGVVVFCDHWFGTRHPFSSLIQHELLTASACFSVSLFQYGANRNKAYSCDETLFFLQ